MRLADKLALGYAYGTSLLAYMVDGPPRPFSATFAVTNRCNLRCSYCNCPLIDPTNLDLPRIEVLFDRLREMEENGIVQGNACGCRQPQGFAILLPCLIQATAL